VTLRLAAGTLAGWRAMCLAASSGEAADSGAAARDWQGRVQATLAEAGIRLTAGEDDGAPLAAELGWGPYGALVLWAAYTEQPQLARPALEPLEWHKDAALARSLVPGFRSRFPALVRGVEVWLPYEGPALVDLPGPAGDDVPAAGLAALAAELGALNGSTWAVGTDEALAWRDGVDHESTRLEDLARRGYAVFLGLCEHASRRSLALWLDY
jgi:hypothetical protein